MWKQPKGNIHVHVLCIYTVYQECQLVPDFYLSVWIGAFDVRTAIRESVDSLCRDDADTPMPPYIRKAYNRPNAAFVSLFR